MKKSLHQLFFAVCIALTGPAFAEPRPLDKVVAIVDKDVIMLSELEERMFGVIQNARGNKLALPSEEVLRKQVIDHLISEHLQLQMARRVGLQITDDQVNLAVDQIRRNNKLTQEQLVAQLRMDGMTLDDLRNKLRRDITLQQIQQIVVNQRIQISQLEIDNFLKSADAQFWISPEYHLGHILISLPQSASTEEVDAARRRAEDMVKRIRAGANFAEIAIAESDGPTALNGGDLGWRKTSDLPSLFADLLPALEPGQVSEPARSPAGFHILMVYDKRGDEQQTETQTKSRHILIKTTAILSDEEAKAKLEKLRQRVLDGEDFGALAKEHSEDIGSMLAGGDLGWSKPGMFVPEFERTMAQMEVGEVSQPFRTQFGWHILQVQERRQENITEEVLREKAARILTSRRFEDELQIWLREMRDEAFVQIKTLTL
ncbi:molecular chaperone SurA [Saccharophagus sp. K07]|jgi:peptidyl-prolyl cis-trans isomerase SurA|uniref:peptidylprolyl isomerase n=1 Tax=Saccharophagus sp. K07 TaxID=2283636 RepID=UPI0016527AB2|nr:peptidylprolyl isomerase [Saccharophagus sp. K07]MBC6904040.1 molecular chaperone SurA [Saccharophagus sp. K07]